MQPRKFAYFGGLALLLTGIFALIPMLSSLPDDFPALEVPQSYGLFLGLMPMNIFNKLAFVALGAMGLFAATSPLRGLPASKWFARIVACAAGTSAILGLIPATYTLGGYAPLFGLNVVVHAVLAAVGGYHGYALSHRAALENRVRFGSFRKRRAEI